MTLVLAFFVLTFAAAWPLWHAASRFSSPVFDAVALLGTITPSLLAIALTRWSDGRAGVAALLGRLSIAGVGVRWYVFALAYFAAIKAMAALGHRAIDGSWPVIDARAALLAIPAMALSTPVQAGEEIGWRGFALPRLESRIGLPAASLVVGVVWALWHLPLFYIAGANYGRSLPMFVLQVTALGVAMAWLHAGTRGSLLLVMLMHSAINQTSPIVQAGEPPGDPMSLSRSTVTWLTAALLWIGAGYFLFRMRGARPGAR